MKNKIIALTTATILLAASCKKEEVVDPLNFETLKTTVLQDFTNNIALRTYADLNNAAVELHTSMLEFNINASDANLLKAQNNWLRMRAIWQQSEAFLLGPIMDNKIHEKMDAFPSNYNEIEDLLASGNPLQISDVEKLPNSQRGFHTLEYMLFGLDGHRIPGLMGGREKDFMTKLSEDLRNNCQSLYSSWVAGTESYASQLQYAATGSKKFKTRREAYVLLTDAMANMCNDLSNNKLQKPFDDVDSAYAESPYSRTSTADFKNDMLSLQNVYLGKYDSNKGYGLSELVASKGPAIDSKLKERINTAMTAIDSISAPFDIAVYNQRARIQIAMDAVDSVESTIKAELKPYILQYITD